MGADGLCGEMLGLCAFGCTAQESNCAGAFHQLLQSIPGESLGAAVEQLPLDFFNAGVPQRQSLCFKRVQNLTGERFASFSQRFHELVPVRNERMLLQLKRGGHVFEHASFLQVIGRLPVHPRHVLQCRMLGQPGAKIERELLRELRKRFVFLQPFWPGEDDRIFHAAGRLGDSEPRQQGRQVALELPIAGQGECPHRFVKAFEGFLRSVIDELVPVIFVRIAHQETMLLQDAEDSSSLCRSIGILQNPLRPKRLGPIVNQSFHHVQGSGVCRGIGASGLADHRFHFRKAA